MRNYKAEEIRNIVLVGGQGTGKTSLAEAMLYKGKVTTRLGKIEEGNTVCDYQPDEIDRQSSINSALAVVEWKGIKINIIDTPGYIDFIGEVISGLKVGETAILVVSAETGIDALVENLWKYIGKYQIPSVVFVNHLNTENIGFAKLVEKLNQRLSKNIIPITLPFGHSGVIDLFKQKIISKESESEIPAEQAKIAGDWRGKLIEAIASCDDALVEKYLQGEELSAADLQEGCKKGIAEKKIVPLLSGSATELVGIESLLNFTANYLPSPADLVRKEITISKHLCAFVFKTVLEPRMGRVNYFKVHLEKVAPGMDVYNSTKRGRERIGPLYFMQGKTRIETREITAGDIGTVVKLKTTSTNDTLTDAGQNFTIPPIEFPKTYVEMAVYPKSRGEEEKIATAIGSVLQEDQTLKFGMNSETKELILSGIGDLQLEIMARRVKMRYGMEMELRRPRVAYKETIRSASEVEGKYKRQTGGHGQYGDVWLKLEPLARGEGFEFVDKIVRGIIPRNYIPAVEKGIKEAMEKGVIAGYPVVDLRTTLYDGSFHEVDSSDLAFKIASSMALQKGVEQAQPTILEPIVKIKVKVPEEYMGQIIGDLNGRRGRVLGMGEEENYRVVNALVPQAELYKYGTSLQSITRGSGSYELTFSHYEECPANIIQNLKEIYQKKKAEGR